jgi:20S proteasome alpha/beta subunit
LPPRTKVSYAEGMTIAAGFKLRDGVLLCADTEFSGGIKTHKEKIVRHYFRGGAIVFAITGNESNAGMAIRDCCYELKSDRDNPYSPKEIEHIIRTAVGSIHKQYVTKNDPISAFEIIIAVRLTGHEPLPACLK